MSSCALLAADTQFERDYRPVFVKNCYACHNERNTSGGLNLAFLSAPGRDATQRDAWETVLRKLQSGEMPPKGLPRPDPSQVDSIAKFVHAEFVRADLAMKPDPGHVTARRLNRVEYANTVRDLLGIDFRAQKDFPADDSGYGFDNIGDVLTVSPVLMEKYLAAAEQISSRAIGADPLPKPTTFERKFDRSTRRTDINSFEFPVEAGFDADYEVRILMTGARGDDAKPVALQVWIDGKPVHSAQIETKTNPVTKVSNMSQTESEDFRFFLSQGEHTVRAAFVNDSFPATLATEKDRLDAKKNRFLTGVALVGPYAAKFDRPTRKRILTCDPASGTTCIQKILSPLAHRAYRRPVAASEIAELVKVFNSARQESYSPEQSLQFAIEAILVSPNFLFRIERNPYTNDPSRIAKIPDLELASRLSYFLWSSMPDEELLSLAENSKLRVPAVLDAQVKRMLADPKASALAENFAGQWLEIRNLDAVKPDPQKFPLWNPELREAMKTETRLFFDAVLKDNRPITEFLDAKYTFLNENLAKFYGIAGVTGPDFRRVDLTTDQRGGVLTQASVLTVTSYPTRTSVVIRGKYLLQNVLASPPPPPPPDVPALDEESVGKLASLRQQMEKHRSNAVCASCHARMDVLGFGLENYDAIGRWRTADGSFPVDPSGTFPNGKSFTTPAQMKTLLTAEMPEFTRCLTEKMLTYALGRGLEAYDRRTVQEIGMRVASDGYKFQSLVNGIVKSLPFQARRGEAVTTGIQIKSKEKSGL